MKKILQIILIGCLGCFLYACDMNTLPKCDSSFAENQIKEIVKSRNQYLQDLSKKNISVYLETDFIEPLSYDKGINKYECKMKLKVQDGNDNYLPKQPSWTCPDYYEYADATVKYSIFVYKEKPVVISEYDSSYDSFWNWYNYKPSDCD